MDIWRNKESDLNMPHALQVFVSSRCTELQDLRSIVRDFLVELGVTPLLSSDKGFPHYDRYTPHVSCLKALDECQLVIGVLDQTYGQRVEDWSPFTQYNGFSPTHAELLHTLEQKKKLLLFVRDDTWSDYHRYKDRSYESEVRQVLGEGKSAIIRMLTGFMSSERPPWVRGFQDAASLRRALQENLVNELYVSFREQEHEARDLASFILEKLFDAAPDVRQKIESELNPELIRDKTELEKKLYELENVMRETARKTEDEKKYLLSDKEQLVEELGSVNRELDRLRITLLLAATKDVRWLHLLRTRLMPKQPGRVPFHNDAEVAMRGYHCSNLVGKKPILKKVTWSKLPYQEEGFHRGYHAGIQFFGGGFQPGTTFAKREVGETAPPRGKTDYWWRLPNIYFVDYMEISTHDDESETPLGYRNTEFAIKSPEGELSEWVRFSYDYDFEKLVAIATASAKSGEELFSLGRYSEAIEPLRKAMVMSQYLDNVSKEETERICNRWNEATDRAALAKLRFREGDKIRVTEGEYKGKTGFI